MYRNKTDGSAELSARLYFLTISGVSCNITVGTFHAAPGPKSGGGGGAPARRTVRVGGGGAARRGRLRALISTLFTAMQTY